MTVNKPIVVIYPGFFDPVTLGHEYSGRVAAVGPGCGRIRQGDRVCGDLETMGGRIGTHRDGAFAPYRLRDEEDLSLGIV